MDFLKEIDKLVQLIESPIFACQFVSVFLGGSFLGFFFGVVLNGLKRGNDISSGVLQCYQSLPIRQLHFIFKVLILVRRPVRWCFTFKAFKAVT